MTRMVQQLWRFLAVVCLFASAQGAGPRVVLEVGRDYAETRLFSVTPVRPTRDAAPWLAVGGFSNAGQGDIADVAVYELTPEAAIVRWRLLRSGGAGSSVRTLRAADLDGDGRDDLIALGRTGDEHLNSRGELQVFRGDGESWATAASEQWQSGVHTHGYGMDVADLDADGALEIVTGGFFLEGEREQAELRVWNLVDGRLVLKARAAWGANEGHTRINAACLGDLDGDGRPEIVSAGRTGQVKPEEHVTDAEADQLLVWQLETSQLRQVAAYAGPLDSRSRIREVTLADVDGRPGLEMLAVGRHSPVIERREGRGRGDGRGGGRGDGSGGGRGDGSGGGRPMASEPELRPLFIVLQRQGDVVQPLARADFGDALGEIRDVAVVGGSEGPVQMLTITAHDLAPHRHARLDTWTLTEGALHAQGSDTAELGDETRARQLLIWNDAGAARVLTIGFVLRGEQVLGQILDWGPSPAP